MRPDINPYILGFPSGRDAAATLNSRLPLEGKLSSESETDEVFYTSDVPPHPFFSLRLKKHLPLKGKAREAASFIVEGKGSGWAGQGKRTAINFLFYYF